MAPKTSIMFLLIILAIFTTCSAAEIRQVRRPCKNLTAYFHDVLYNGNNKANATAAIIGEPAWANKTALHDDVHFGDLMVFDGPLTADENLMSQPIGRAQGIYMYTGKNMISNVTSWHAFSLIFNSTNYNGTVNVAGVNSIFAPSRDFPVIGGTNDFFMHRGILTFKTRAVEGYTYYRVHMDIKLYECWNLV